MRAALAGDRPVQPCVHFIRVDEPALAAAGQEFAQRRRIRLLGFRAKAQQIDALLQHGAQARIATSRTRILGDPDDRSLCGSEA